MGGTRQPNREGKWQKKDKFLWLSSQAACISDSISTVLCPGFDPWECTDFTQPSRLRNLMYISTGEQLKMFQKQGSVCNELLAAVISPKHPPSLHNQTSE